MSGKSVHASPQRKRVLDSKIHHIRDAGKALRQLYWSRENIPTTTRGGAVESMAASSTCICIFAACDSFQQASTFCKGPDSFRVCGSGVLNPDTCSVKAAIDSLPASGCTCVPMKLYLQKQWWARFGLRVVVGWPLKQRTRMENLNWETVVLSWLVFVLSGECTSFAFFLYLFLS